MEYREYKEMCHKTLKEDKNFPLDVNADQAEIILEPVESPESFYMDGEIDHKKAVAIYITRLKKVGFNTTHIHLIMKYVGL